MYLFYLLLIVMVLLLICFRCESKMENFIGLYVAQERWPTLLSHATPIQMLRMEQKYIQDGYRFQKTIFEPEPVNQNVHFVTDAKP